MLWDLDGTLVDHETAVTEALHTWLPALGVAPTADLLRLWGTLLERHLLAWRDRRISFAEQRRRRLRDFLPAVGLRAPGDDDELDAVFAGYLRCYEDAWRAFDDASPALDAIDRAGLRCAVLTNGSLRQQTGKLVRTGLRDRVGPVFTPEELGAAKPTPAAFLAACQRWGLPAAAVVNVGDRYDLDVLAARAAGLRAVHLDRHGAGPGEEPLRVRSLHELAGLLADLR